MQTTLTKYQGFTHQEVERLLQSTENETISFVKLQAKHDGQNLPALTSVGFKIKIADVVQASIQSAVDRIRQVLLTAARVVDTAELQKNTDKQIAELFKEIQTTERHQNELQLQRAALKPDFFKMRLRPYVRAVSILVGISDGFIAFGSFRAVYPFINSFVAAFSIAGIISLSDLGYTTWINSSPVIKEKMRKSAMILSIALMLFVGIGYLRSAAADAVINIDPAAITVFNSTQTMPGITIASISFALFVFVFALSLFFYQAKQERVDEEIYKQLCLDIEQDGNTIKVLETEKLNLVEALHQQKRDVRNCYDYTKKSILRAKNIGEKSIRLYKLAYAQTTTEIPAFFNEPCPLYYDESLDFFDFKNEQQ